MLLWGFSVSVSFCYPKTFTFEPLGYFFTSSGRVKHFPFASFIFAFAVAEYAKAATVTGWRRVPAPSTLPATTTTWRFSACRLMRLRLIETLLLLVLDRVCAILLQIFTLLSLDALFKKRMRFNSSGLSDFEFFNFFPCLF